MTTALTGASSLSSLSGKYASTPTVFTGMVMSRSTNMSQLTA